MAGNRPVVGGTYTGPRSEPGGQNTPRAGRSIAAFGAYKTGFGSFAQQMDQGLIWDDTASGLLTASAPAAVGGGVTWSDDFEDGDLAGWGPSDTLSGVFTSTNDAAVGHDGGRALHIISNATGSGMRRYEDDTWTYTDTLFKFWLRVNALAQNTALIQARDDLANTVWAFAYDVVNTHAEVAIFNESGFVTFLQLPNGSLGLNTWAYFELRMKAEVAGQASLTQDGGTPVTYSGDLHRSVPLRDLQFWAEYGNQNTLIDDIVLVHDPDASAVESFSASDTGSGTATASGTATELNIFTGTGAGTVTASGSGVEGSSYTDSRTATATASGSSSENFSASDTNSSTTTATGSSSEQSTYTDAGAATVTSSGSGSENFGVSYNDSRAGTVTATGTASEGQSLTDSSAGTGALSGSGSENAQRSGSGNADLVAAGTGSDSSSHTGQGSGAGILSGTGVESYSSATGFQDSGSGSITAAGSGSDFHDYTDGAALTITVTGTGDDSYQVADVANANVTAEGAGTESSIRDSTADGIVTTAGSGVEFIGQPPERSDIIWGIQAGPRATASISTISSNSTLLSPPRPSPSIQEKQPVKVEVAT